MKKFINGFAYFKLHTAIIWIAMLIIYMLTKTILGVYEVTFFTIIELMIMAVFINLILHLFENRISIMKIRKSVFLVLQGIFMIGTILSFNEIFYIYEVFGIQYLYLLSLLIFCYCGALFGFHIMTVLDVEALNGMLGKYNNKKDNL